MENSKHWTSDAFFERLDFFLKAHDWTLYQLCAHADITVDSLYKLRARRTLPSLQSVCTICDILGISLSDFFGTEITDPDRATILSSFDTLSDESVAILALLVKHLK